MIYTENGLDLNFVETRKSLGMTKPGDKKRFSQDEMFERFGEELERIDYRQFITRFRWANLPEGLDSELIERILYYSGSAMFFYIPELKRFYFLPYGMSGEKTMVGIDFYGRYNRLKPYSFNGATSSEGEINGDGKISQADIFLSTQIRDNIKDIPVVKSVEEAEKIYNNGAVICWDHTPGLAYYQNARNRTSKAYIKYMIKILIQTKSALVNASGFNLFSTDNESAEELMQMQLDQINEDREEGKLSAVVSKLLGEIQNLQSNTPNAIADFWSAYQSADNLRLKSLGIQNDGVQQKSQYQNIQEQSMDVNDALQVYFNAFMERVKFSAIVNSIWGLDIYPQPLLMPQMGGATTDTIEMDEEPQTQAQEGTANA